MAHSYEEYVVNLLLFLLHCKFQKVKIVFSTGFGLADSWSFFQG